jgi:hypothetical protein
MQVDILQEGKDFQRAVLKLYDRRFSEQHRADEKIEPWNEDVGKAYSQFVRSGSAGIFLWKLQIDGDFEALDEGWSAAEKEVFLHYWCMEMYKAETEVYERMRNYQGKQIPGLFAKVTLNNEVPKDAVAQKSPQDSGPEGCRDQSARQSEATVRNIEESTAALNIKEENPGIPENSTYEETEPHELEQIPGILMEFIDGFTLAQIADNAPPASWQQIVDQAIQNVHLVSDHDIRNDDIRTSNILVAPSASDVGGYRVVTIDFGQCKFRQEADADLDWYREKSICDEEGAVGRVMRNRLAKLGFELKYKSSGRYDEWADREP